jgi:O-antigen ligase
MSPTTVACWAFALFLVAGRWSFARISGGDGTFFVLEPRVWLVAIACAIAFAPVAMPRSSLSANARKTSALLLAFLAYHIVSSAWAPEFEPAWNKAVELALIAMVLVAMLRLAPVLPPRELADGMWRALVVIFGAFAALALLGSSAGESRIAVLGGGPNVFGRNMALLALFCVNALLVRGARPLPILGLSVSGLLVLLSGSRGAMLASTIGVLVLLWVHRVKPSKLLWLALSGVVLVTVLATFTEVGRAAFAMFNERVVKLTIEQEYDSGRSTLFDQAVAVGRAVPMYGEGLAGFRAHSSFDYPHNMLLEAWAEGGLVGLVLTIAAVLLPLKSVLQRNGRHHALELAAFAALLASAQFSGDFYDSRGVLLFGLLAVMQDGGAAVKSRFGTHQWPAWAQRST